MDIDWSSASSLEDNGFNEAWTVTELRRFIDNGTLNHRVPGESGVYVVLRVDNSQPSFVQRGTGGVLDRRDPNVEITELEDEWVTGTPVMYIGHSNCLRRRIRRLIRFGRGEAAKHWGGRYMWQLRDAKIFQVCWMVSDDYDLLRDEFIDSFYLQFDRLPFANLRH